MSSQPNIKASMRVLINGGQLDEEAMTKVTWHPGINIVATKGVPFGISKGAPSMEVSIESTVPAEGFEYNPGPDSGNAQFVQLTLMTEFASLTTLGIIMGHDLSNGVNGGTQLNLTFSGEYSDWVAL